MMPSPQEQTTQTANSAQQNVPMEVNSQYSSCETLDSHRSSEYDDEANGSDEKGKRSRRISSENTDYIAKERVTRAAPPKPAYNPMQFIAQKPSNLFQTAQAQLKKAEEIKKTKETTKKEEPEEWQNNLDNWKSSRRKRVEHIIDRVVEVKKLEEEEIDRNRKKSKTFNELMEKRGALKKIAVYTEEDDAIDMSGLNDVNDSKDPGDNVCENNNNNNDSHVDLEQSQSTNITKKANDTITTVQTTKSEFQMDSTALVRDVIQKTQVDNSREKIEDKSPMNKSYTTSVNLKFTRETFGNSQERDGYDDAIEGYKNRVSKAAKSDLPKVNINERRDLFEKEEKQNSNNSNTITAAISESININIKDRISAFNQNLSNSAAKSPPKEVEIPTSTKLKDRLMSLNQLLSPTIESEQDISRGLSSQFSRMDLAELNPNVFELPVDKPNLIDDERTNENSSSQPYVTDVNPQQIHDGIKEEVKLKSEDLECADMESSVIEEALDMAFEIIDNETDHSEYTPIPMDKKREPIYQNLDNNNYGREEVNDSFSNEMHYQIPRSREPYYVVPKSQAKVHLYENVEMIFPNSSDSSRFSMAESNESFGVDDGTEMVFPVDQSKYLSLQPPKEKPPPLPEQNEIQVDQSDNFRRINSTKRIKQEIQNKRFSFLGIEDSIINDFTLELSVAPPPSMQALLKQGDKRVPSQIFQKSDNNNGNLDLGESRDSGLSDNHSRQSSEPSSNSSETGPNGYAFEMNNSGVPMSEMRGNYTSYSVNDDDTRIKSLENQISKQQTHPNVHHRLDTCDDDQQEVLRVEQILLQIEQQELKRQRESLMLRKKVARREFDEGVKLLMTNEPPCDMPNIISRTNSNGDVYSTPHYENVHMRHHHHNQSQDPSFYINDYRKSMPNLQEQVYNEWQKCSNNIAISPPSLHLQNTNNCQNQFSSDLNAFSKSEMSLNHQNLAMRSFPPVPTHHHHPNNQPSDNAANRQVLMQICAVPKPKLTNEWIQYRKPDNPRTSLNSHWLIQEAEQRRIEQMNSLRTNNHGSGTIIGNRKSLPDSVIQSVQQRVHNAGLGINVSKRYTVFDSKYMPPPQQTPLLMLSTKNNQQQQDQLQHQLESPVPHGTNFPMLPSIDLLSVSSKKLCNYCNYELGSGAAMIIENLGLFFHLDCFKCSVCQAAISDGNIQGTDVRVRNNKLHCKNCFSNEEGVKFSCV